MAKVKYLLVGGYAVNFYGYHRATDDLDVWIAVGPANAELVSKVLRSFADFPPESVPAQMFLAVGRVFMFGREPVRIDILTGPSGVEFADCYERRNEAELDGLVVPIISLEDLKQNKRASGRPKDLADLAQLPPQASVAPKRPKRPRARRRPPKK